MLLKRLKAFDKWCDSHFVLILLVFFLILLRLPNFFEPYWYGDEGIYLTIGNGLQQGKMLYSQIVDHKTPIIYYFASLGGQLEFRVLLFAWMLMSTLAFFHLAKELLHKSSSIILATAFFVLFTSLPWFEGNIPNGELFVMGFILMGAYFFSSTTVFNDLFKAENQWLKNIGLGNKEESLSALFPSLFKRENWLLGLTGVFFGLAILTKVPALFDVAAFFAVFYLQLARDFFSEPHLKIKKLFLQLKELLGQIGFMLLGLLAPIVLSVFYYLLRGAGTDYLQYGLLYNFRYAGNWELPFSSATLEFLFSLPGKLILVFAVILFVTILSRKMKAAFQFSVIWFVLALFAATLSNRPYPHYFLQVIPSLVLVIFTVLDDFLTIKIKKKRLNFKFHWKSIRPLSVALALALTGSFLGVLLALKVGLYPTASYYKNFAKYMTGIMKKEEYYNSFNELMTDNYNAARIIRRSGEREIFIWGTNPMLYALSETSPTGKYTVSFHIRDFSAQPETLASLEEKKPYFIVVMHNENDEFPEFGQFLHEYYIPNLGFKHFTLWKLL